MTPAQEQGRSARREYGWTFAALLALLAATVVAAHLPLGAAGPVVAYAIAAAKALLVAWHFMHLAHRGGVTRLFACSGLVWLAILVALSLADYGTRGECAPGGSWREPPAGAPAPAPERRDRRREE